MTSDEIRKIRDHAVSILKRQPYRLHGPLIVAYLSGVMDKLADEERRKAREVSGGR